MQVISCDACVYIEAHALFSTAPPGCCKSNLVGSLFSKHGFVFSYGLYSYVVVLRSQEWSSCTAYFVLCIFPHLRWDSIQTSWALFQKVSSNTVTLPPRYYRNQKIWYISTFGEIRTTPPDMRCSRYLAYSLMNGIISQLVRPATDVEPYTAE